MALVDNKGDNWRWNAGLHGTPRITGMQVIENPDERPRQFPVGFAPKHPAISQQRRQSPFPPQVVARQRI